MISYILNAYHMKLTQINSKLHKPNCKTQDVPIPQFSTENYKIDFD